jgi:hypothetical protein
MIPSRKTAIETDEVTIIDAELVAFTLFESARLLCERMLSERPTEDPLGRLHRELGLAGYCTSMDFAPATRERCLILARQDAETDSGFGRMQALRAMFEETVTASDAIATLQTCLGSDHLNEAQGHAISALEALDDEIHALCL